MPIKNLKNKIKKIKIYKMGKLKIGMLILVVGMAIMWITTSEVSAGAICEKPGTNGCTNYDTYQCCINTACWHWEPLYMENECFDYSRHWVWWGYTNPFWGKCECHL